jgi:two-component system cell cycle response regulator
MTRKRRVLVVEDNVPNMVMLQAKLLDRQFDVAAAHNGAEGLALIEREAFDVVLLDIMLPGMDGFDVCRRIRAMADRAETPVIMLTALDTEADRAAGSSAGADAYFLKPVEDEVLFGCMDALMQERASGARA